MKRQARFVLVAALLLACAGGPRADEQEPLDHLIQRAAAAVDHQAELYAQVIRREEELASQTYNAGDTQAAHAALAAIGEYGEKLLAAAKAHPKHLKPAEIILRETSRNLQQLGQALDVDEQPRVKQAVTQLEKARSDLLAIMFAPPGKQR